MLSRGEEVIWRGKPQKKAFILKRTLTLMPIAIVWLAFDMGFIITAFQDMGDQWFLIPFFAFHLMPVWMWLASIVTAGRNWQNTEYLVTNRRIVIQSGFWAVNEVSLYYKEIEHTQMNVCFIDKMCHTGSIRFNGSGFNGNSQRAGFILEALENSNEVYQLIQKVVLDIQTDIEYPNALRPEINEGYKTEYRP